MKILIDEMNPDSVILKGNKKPFEKYPNRLYLAICFIEDSHLKQLGKNFKETIEKQPLTLKNEKTKHSKNIGALFPSYQNGYHEHESKTPETNNFKCYCKNKKPRKFQKSSDLCLTRYQTQKMAKIIDLLISSPTKHKLFLQFLDKNYISIDIFVINCNNVTYIKEKKQSKGEKEIVPEDLYNQTGILSHILSELAYEKLNDQDSVDMYIDYGKFLNIKKIDLVSQYVKSKLKRELFYLVDIEQNIPEVELDKLKKVGDDINQIFKLLPRRFGGERNVLINFVHQTTAPIILFPDLILKSYKRLYLDSVSDDEQENLQLFNKLTQLNSKEKTAKIKVGNMRCDGKKKIKNDSKKSCTQNNLIYSENNNQKKLVGNQTLPRYRCGWHYQNLTTKEKLGNLIKKHKKFKSEKLKIFSNFVFSD